eukprot:g49979.t1
MINSLQLAVTSTLSDLKFIRDTVKQRKSSGLVPGFCVSALVHSSSSRSHCPESIIEVLQLMRTSQVHMDESVTSAKLKVLQLMQASQLQLA